jgi:hypothetical protein
MHGRTASPLMITMHARTGRGRNRTAVPATRDRYRAIGYFSQKRVALLRYTQ